MYSYDISEQYSVIYCILGYPLYVDFYIAYMDGYTFERDRELDNVDISLILQRKNSVFKAILRLS